VLVAVTSYVTDADVAPGFLLTALSLGLALDIGGRLGVRTWLRRHEIPGNPRHPVLAVGEAAGIVAFAQAVNTDGAAGMSVRAACLIDRDSEHLAALASAGIPVIGDVGSAVESARAVGARTIAVLSPSELGSERLRSMTWELEGTGIDLLVAPGLAEVAGRRVRVRSIAWIPLLSVAQPEFRGLKRLAKEVSDRLLALVAVIVLMPLLVVISAVVRFSSPGPALFRQTRVGRDGRTFRMLKFRSMFVDAESRLAELSSENLYRAGPLFKVHDDPRITRAGRVLRRYSLDELPQLLNVIAGHMSLVGPRPPLPSEVVQYEDDARRRLLVKPGMTGLWQVSGRNDLDWADSVRLDLRYVENWSPALDLLILWKTAAVVFRGSGAY
jgi:exopolysaccharide biosynthesis polyprenyl glycosylphosphotransferase